MPMDFSLLFAKMEEKGLTTYQIRKQKIITEPTLQRLRHNGNVTTDAIGKLCEVLGCQPGDIMEWVPDDDC